MRSGRKLDKNLTSLFKFDKNTSATLDRLVAEIHQNKELCSYQFLNHPGSQEMLAGILKLLHSEDKRYVTWYLQDNSTLLLNSPSGGVLGVQEFLKFEESK